MMQLYYSRISWISGISFFIAFAITFWPSRGRILAAAVLWCVGALSIGGLASYDSFLRGALAHAFGTGAFPLLGWLLPLLFLIFAAVESALLFPWISQQRALDIGRVLFLIIAPGFVVLCTLAETRGAWKFFPLGIEWLGLPLLWLRIRERLQ